MIRQAVSAALVLLALSLLTGVLYPLALTGAAALAFPGEASGSLVRVGDRTVGSRLIGQPFSSARYFWGRPSATPGRPYNGLLSGASNLGPTNPELVRRVQARLAELRGADPGNDAPVPVDLATASASGLDPHISPAAAYYQVHRVSGARGLGEEEVRSLVTRTVRSRQFGLLGEPTVNVLELNLALDRLARRGPGGP